MRCLRPSIVTLFCLCVLASPPQVWSQDAGNESASASLPVAASPSTTAAAGGASDNAALVEESTKPDAARIAPTQSAATQTSTTEAASTPTAGSPTPGDATKPMWTLAYRFMPNETLRYTSHQKIKLHATFEAAERIDVSEFRQKRVFTVQSVDDSNRAKLAMQFEHVWMMKKVDDEQPVEFESTMKPDDVPVVFRQVAHELKGLATVYYLSPDGTSAFAQFASSQKPSSNEEKVENAVTLVEGDEREKPIQLASASSKGDAKQKDAGTFLMPLPDKPVGIGDSWKHTVTVPVRLTAEINRNIQILRTFRLDAVDGDIATISFRSSIESPVKTPVVRGQLIQALPRGTMQFDHVRGRMVKLNMFHNQSVFGATGQNGVLNCVGESTEELISDNSNSTSNAATSNEGTATVVDTKDATAK